MIISLSRINFTFSRRYTTEVPPRWHYASICSLESFRCSPARNTRLWWNSGSSSFQITYQRSAALWTSFLIHQLVSSCRRWLRMILFKNAAGAQKKKTRNKNGWKSETVFGNLPLSAPHAGSVFQKFRAFEFRFSSQVNESFANYKLLSSRTGWSWSFNSGRLLHSPCSADCTPRTSLKRCVP